MEETKQKREKTLNEAALAYTAQRHSERMTKLTILFITQFRTCVYLRASVAFHSHCVVFIFLNCQEIYRDLAKRKRATVCAAQRKINSIISILSPPPFHVLSLLPRPLSECIGFIRENDLCI